MKVAVFLFRIANASISFWCIDRIGHVVSVVFFYFPQGYSSGLTTQFRNGVILFAAGWFVAHVVAEMVSLFSSGFRSRHARLLLHLRYAPLAIWIAALLIVAAFDRTMIVYSKYEIRRYLKDPSPTVSKPQLVLHNDYRGWCGNGITLRSSDLYLNTALEGIDDPRKEVRLRSMLVIDKVQDFFNGSDRNLLRNVAKKLCDDASPEVVRAVSETGWGEHQCVR